MTNFSERAALAPHPFGGGSTLEVDPVQGGSSGPGPNPSNYTRSNPLPPLRGEGDHWTGLVDWVVRFCLRSEGVGGSTRGRGSVENSYVEMVPTEILQCETLALMVGRHNFKTCERDASVVASIRPGDGGW